MNLSDEQIPLMFEGLEKEKIFYGVDVNCKEGIAFADEQYVRSTQKVLEQSKLGGMVYAWDVMDAPNSHFF